MAALQAQNLFTSLPHGRRVCQASLSSPSHPRKNTISLSDHPTSTPIEKLSLSEETTTTTTTNNDNQLLLSKLHAIAEAAAERADMHTIIGQQRNNWNLLLLPSVNSINLAASIMAGIASSIPIDGEPHSSQHLLPLKLSSALLFAAAAGVMAVVNTIQPSQLGEEQRNASRLFNQLHRSIHTRLALGPPSQPDLEEAMERVLALDKAYPLSLLPGMLDKFPKLVEPTKWWPKPQTKRQPLSSYGEEGNGWGEGMEEEMKGVARVLKSKDVEEYLRLGRLVVTINRALAIAGPLLAGSAAVGASLIGTCGGDRQEWPALAAVVGGALAAVVNTVEHGGQVGMVFELFRNCAGYYRRLAEEIECNLGEREADRENGELFEMKMALLLGRGVSELKGFAAYALPPTEDEEIQESAGKLF